MKKKTIWLLWLGGVVILGAYFGYRLFGAEDKSVFLIGATTDGHHQIELACGACHTSPFGGGELLQKACVNCHGEALRLAHDSHPKSKFTDPRNADRLQFLDARYCVTCHREHRRDQTHPMGLTLPEDYCFRCHADIAKDRPSHAGMAFSTCASSGCHHFHDNTALYEDYLVKFADEPALKPSMLRPALAPRAQKHPGMAFAVLTGADAGAPPAAQRPRIVDEWALSAHAQAGVNCKGCHQPRGAAAWDDHPGLAVCKGCHAAEADSFFDGKHGMRLDPRLPTQLSPMTPAQGRLPFKHDALHRELTCNSCHGAHRYDTRKAAVDSCIACHDDEHSRNYAASKHAQLWRDELAGRAPARSGVSCASCHMPRVERELESGSRRVLVDHNQNDNLRPRDKMIRSVCENCHGLAFSIDALADRALVERNFDGLPAHHVESIDMAVKKAGDKKH